MNPLLQWWSSASSDEKKWLADEVGSTVGSLHQIAHAYRTHGQLSLTPDLARSIERALAGKIKREQMCPACSRCEYVSRCTHV